MIEVAQYKGPADIIPGDEIRAWKNSLKVVVVEDCPVEVKDFINAIADKMTDFGQIGKFYTSISGAELLLANMKEINGETVYPWYAYEIPVPHMVAVDHHRWMLRAFKRRGKQGLIDYCKAQVRSTELEKVLEILNVEVFQSHRSEYKKVMADIQSAKKLESKISV